MTGVDRPKLTLIHDDGRDMPPSWDGVPVTWSEWAPEPLTTARFHGGTEMGCESCGNTDTRMTSTGRVKHTNEKTGRTRQAIRFLAYRCRYCRTDFVHDETDDTFWELEYEDYGPKGSVAS